MVTKLSDQRFQLRIPTAAILTFRDWWSRRSSGFILGYERLEQLELWNSWNLLWPETF